MGPSLARLGLERELAHWRAQGRTPCLWWRDDDARAPTAGLDRLLALAERVPVGLAIIPDGDLAGLARRLANRPGVTLGQHGFDHRNRRQTGEPLGEHAMGVDAAAIAARVSAGRRHLLEAGLAPSFYAPPWNCLDDGLADALATVGFDLLSGWGAQRRGGGAPARLDTHLDLMRWKPTPRFRGAARVLHELRVQLAARRAARAFEEPIGLLTHHLVHDAPAWAFLDGFVRYTTSRFTWRAPREAAFGGGLNGPLSR